MSDPRVDPAALTTRVDDAAGATRPAAKPRLVTTGRALDVTVGGPLLSTEGVQRQLPPMMASAHRVSAHSSGELGEPDFGNALQRWLNLERHRIVVEFLHLDQVQAVAEAYATPADVARPDPAPSSRQLSDG